MCIVMHRRLVYRQLHNTRQQGGILILCVALAVLAHVTVGSLRRGVQTALLNDTKQLHAADVIVKSHSAFAPATVTTVAELQRQGVIELAQAYEFYAMTRALRAAHDATLLTHLKVVEAGYPFYGRVELASGRELHEALTPGNVIVDPRLLERLGVQIGDRVQVGESTLTIRDVVLREPDRPLQFFLLGPRMFVALADLPALGLLQKGSHIHYKYMLKVMDDTMLDRVAETLQQSASEYEQVTTFHTAESGVKTFFDNFLFYLNVTAAYTLLLAGIGMQSTLRALIRASEATIATVKTVGATNGFITRHFTVMVLILGGMGTLIGLALGGLGLPAVAWLFQDILPSAARPSLSWATVWKARYWGVSSWSCLPFCHSISCAMSSLF